METTTYTGGPDECSYCYVWCWTIVKLGNDGSCPNATNHRKYGPAADR